MSFFIAIDIDDVVRAETAALIAQEREVLRARWLKPEKLHVTLQFLGSPSEGERAVIEQAVAPVALRHRPFELRLAGSGVFETARAASVLWLGIEGELDPLRALQRDVASSVKVVEDKPFLPHLTLARSKEPHAFVELSQRLMPFRTAAFRVSHVTLYESTHDRYVACGRWSFSNA